MTSQAESGKGGGGGHRERATQRRPLYIRFAVLFVVVRVICKDVGVLRKGSLNYTRRVVEEAVELLCHHQHLLLFIGQLTGCFINQGKILSVILAMIFKDDNTHATM